MKKIVAYAFLTLGLSIGAAAACGGETPAPQTPETAPSSSAAASATPSAVPTTTASATPSATPSASSTAQTPPAAIALMPLQKSSLVDKLKEAGLDPKKLPKLSKVEHSKLGKVMNTFTTALGYKCMDCHTDDFKAWTPKKKIAEHMWDEFVVALANEDGSPLYCDSCHQGRGKILDRTDKKVLSGFMQTNFVDKLKRTDKKDHGCETCHGDPFDGDILSKWTK